MALLAVTGEGNFWTRTDFRVRNPEVVRKVINLETKANKLETEVFSYHNSLLERL